MSSWKELQKLSVEERSKLKWNDPRIIDYVSTVEQQFNLPKHSLLTVLHAENSYIDKSNSVKLNTSNDSTTVSKAMARGVMQFTDATMSLMNGRWKHKADDPLENVWFAADYFSHTLNNQYKGNVVAAIADYNGGPENKKKGIKNALNVMVGKLPDSKETKDYLTKAAFFANSFEAGAPIPAPEPPPATTPEVFATTTGGAVTGKAVLKNEGLVEHGNIDLTKRPVVKNADGSISTVRSMGVNIDGKEVLIPTVVGNKVVSDEEAVAHYKKTGEHLGVFKDAASSSAYAQKLHSQQEEMYVERPQEPSVAVAPKQERVLKYDAGGKRMPSLAEK
jgi:hypothetical protein